MKGKRRHRTSCPRKQPMSRDEAIGAAMRQRHELGRNVQAYRCTACKFWHVGNRKRSRKRKAW